jgi:hypothetical protein
MTNHERETWQLAIDLVHTFMPNKTPDRVASAIPRVYACLLEEGSDSPSVEDDPDAWDQATGLLKSATMLPFLAEWIAEAEALHASNRHSAKEGPQPDPAGPVTDEGSE